MITFDQIKHMPLSQLLIYKDALETLSSHYEKDVLPLYGMAMQYDQRTPEQLQSMNKLSNANAYLKIIYQAIEYNVFNGLDRYEQPKLGGNMKCETPVTPEEATITEKKKKTNVKKTSKKN